MFNFIKCMEAVGVGGGGGGGGGACSIGAIFSFSGM